RRLARSLLEPTRFLVRAQKGRRRAALRADRLSRKGCKIRNAFHKMECAHTKRVDSCLRMPRRREAGAETRKSGTPFSAHRRRRSPGKANPPLSARAGLYQPCGRSDRIVSQYGTSHTVG